MPVIVSKANDKQRRSLSIHQPEKCGTQNSRILLLETEPYKRYFRYDADLLSAWNSFVILRNHFDRLLSVWYHGCVDPRNQTGVPRPVYETHPADTFRCFIKRICSGLYAKDIHVLPYTASHQREFYSFSGDSTKCKFKNDVQICNYIAPMGWSAHATYLRLENMSSIFPVINEWLGLPVDTCKELWGADLKGNHHIEYSDTETAEMMDASALELLEYKARHGAFPSGNCMWDAEMYEMVESCEAYRYDHDTFPGLGILSRHGTDEYETGKTQVMKATSQEHEMWKRFASIYETAPDNMHSALDDVWENFRKYPYFWPAMVVGQPDFWWQEIFARYDHLLDLSTKS